MMDTLKYGCDFSNQDDIQTLVIRQGDGIVSMISGENARHVFNYIKQKTTICTGNSAVIANLQSKLARYEEALREIDRIDTYNGESFGRYAEIARKALKEGGK